MNTLCLHSLMQTLDEVWENLKVLMQTLAYGSGSYKLLNSHKHSQGLASSHTKYKSKYNKVGVMSIYGMQGLTFQAKALHQGKTSRFYAWPRYIYYLYTLSEGNSTQYPRDNISSRGVIFRRIPRAEGI